MKNQLAVGLLGAFGLCGLLTTGCTTNMAESAAGGAAVGAVSASFVGALTDLVVDGRVNEYRLKRNLVGGAIVGGTAGAIAGHQKDKTDAVRQQAEEQKQAQAVVAKADEELIQEMGPINYDALVFLINRQHEDAYAKTLRAAETDNTNHRLTAFALQALIDRDRNNEAGVTKSLQRFIALDKEIKELEEANKQLDILYRELLDERRIQGIR